ncbi:MAG: BBP7 family outer membrane beta-barrel protein [Planctomycetaceae bacterium]|nr:BBP7 family outer membrane beta-barrel protein [Planctomycetaceae bacterium]
MRLTTILLAAMTALVIGPARANAQDVAQAVTDQLASLASFSGLSPEMHNPYPAEDTCCGDGRCGCCSHCCHRMDIWGSAEFLLWWTKGSVTPPLVTTSPPGTPEADAGVLPGADILFGQSYLGDEDQAGGRITLGVWLDPDHNCSFVGRFYGLGGASDRFQASSDGDPILALPFFNVLLDQNDSLKVAFPGLTTGSINASLTNDFYSAEAYFQLMMERNCNRRVDVIAGYQFARLDDWLQIDSSSILLQQGGIQADIRDRFSTQNQFHGGMIGVRAQMMRGCWSIDTLAKIGLGVNRQQVEIAGRTILDGFATVSGGLLAQDTNIGTFQRDKFAAIPELTINLRYHVNPCLSFHVGYTLIYFADVVTAGRQIDTGVNTSQIGGVLVGPARPTFEFRDEYYWLQGVNFGVNWDF